MISLICVTYNNFAILKQCLKSIVTHTSLPFQLFLIDNNSKDDTYKLYNYHPSITVVRNNENKWWCGGINQGIRLALESDYTVFMNDDIVVGPNWLEQLTSVLKYDKSVGAVGPLCSSPRDWQNYDRVKEKIHPSLPSVDRPREDVLAMNKALESFDKRYIHVKGMLAFFLTAFRTETIKQIGYLDERFLHGGDDDDYCRRLENAGYKLALSLGCYTIHHAGASLNRLESSKKKELKELGSSLLRLKYPSYYQKA